MYKDLIRYPAAERQFDESPIIHGFKVDVYDTLFITATALMTKPLLILCKTYEWCLGNIYTTAFIVGKLQCMLTDEQTAYFMRKNISTKAMRLLQIYAVYARLDVMEREIAGVLNTVLFNSNC